MKRFLGLLLLGSLAAAETPNDDPYVWLEDSQSSRTLEWVRARNEATRKELEAQPDFAALQSRLQSIFDSKERIPYVRKQGKYFYNYWRDAEHVRGVWRRTTLEEYQKESPVWETVLDLDALAANEQENWVWDSVQCLRPIYDRCLIGLSRGGSDAHVIREFDVERKQFVADGFQLPEAKSSVAWRSRDELFVGTDFGPGSLTDSGYPRSVKSWRRGTPLTSAKLLFEGKASDMSVAARVYDADGFRHEFIVRRVNLYAAEYRLLDGNRLRKLSIPPDAEVSSFRDQILLTLRTDWHAYGNDYSSGSLIAMPWHRFLTGWRDFRRLYVPGPRSSLGEVRATRNHLIVDELDNVRSSIYTLTYKRGVWERAPLPIPASGAVGAAPVDESESDEYFLTVTNFVTPNSLYFGTVGTSKYALLKQLPSFFNADGLVVSQHQTTSKDGTLVSYFEVAKRDVPLDGNNPTLLYGYGGFEMSYKPTYSASIGSAWLERGGVYVVANIRGGGEFGPRWHQAALKENRQRAYDDFSAIAEDLIARKITSPRHLGIMGGSNGGLLMGVMLTQRPDLFGAIVSQNPLLDMRRYHKLLAGASWMSEYGDPDKPEEWAYISRYSPYQNARPDAQYPRILFTTSMRDDRVHPGHARKMAAKLLDQRHDVLFFENIQGGHSGSANSSEQAYVSALAYTFLWKQLK